MDDVDKFEEDSANSGGHSQVNEHVATDLKQYYEDMLEFYKSARQASSGEKRKRGD